MSIDMYTIDLDFLGINEAIPVFVFPTHGKIFLVECGPGSTLVTLERKLKPLGYGLDDISDVFITHIHLDHAGAAGSLARRGARIHVHPSGARHLIDPEKLITSAERIYGDQMQTLWGDFLPVAEKDLSILEDGQVIKVGDIEINAIHTPGHANHHIAYVIDGICFSGDVGGSRMPGQKFITLPMPPPDFHLETWYQTIEKLKGLDLKQIVVTHYGAFDDVAWHLATLQEKLEDIDVWMRKVMPTAQTLEDVHQQYMRWIQTEYDRYGIPEEIRKKYEGASPSWMTPAGLFRYWNKYRREQSDQPQGK